MAIAAAPAASLPADLRRLLDEFTAIERDTETLLAGLDDEQFNWGPPGGGWSIAQCFDHLTVATRVYLDCMQAAVTRARGAGWNRRGPIRSTWFGRRFVQSLEPPVRLRVRAPGKIRPGSRRRKAEVWPEFVRATADVSRLLQEAADLDMNRATFRNPFLPLVRVRVGTGFRILAAHDRRHLAQAAAIRALDAFPRS